MKFFDMRRLPQIAAGAIALAWVVVPSAAAIAQTTPVTILRLSGSTTIGDTLAPALVESWLKGQGATGFRRTIVMEAGENIGEIDAAMLGGQSVQVEIKHKGSGTGFADLDQGITDVVMSSGEYRDVVKPAESASLTTKYGDLTSHYSENVIALDGLAIIVSPSNPINSLTTDQIRAIFTKKVTNWNALGGNNGSIHVFIRDKLSGTFDTFKKLVLQPTDSMPDPITVAAGSAQMDADVAKDPDAIGFVSSGLVRDSHAVAVSRTGLTPLLPTTLTIKTEDYVLSRRLYLYLPQVNPPNAYANQFIQFAKSDQGQAIVDTADFVDLIPLPVQASTTVARTCALSQQYPAIWHENANSLCKLRDRMRQLTTSFYFDSDSDQLDTLADDQVQRAFAQIEKGQATSVVLAGFTDSTGSYAGNCQLALSRAHSVAAELAKRGVEANLQSFCSEQPIDDNTTDAGRKKNRRVEIYIQ